jgi:DNA polymerase-3 subunit epsilon
MRQHWSETPVHVIDFEGSRATGVLEYGVATIRHGRIESVHTRICQPSGMIPEAETHIHGISEADTAGQKPFSDELGLFMDLRSSGPLCAHNAAFERHLLKAIWPYPRQSPDFLNPGRSLADWGPWIDTLRLYELIFPMLTDHSLGALLDAFALREKLEELSASFCPPKRSRFHCALYDALGSAVLLSHLGSLPGYEDLGLDWLLVHSLNREENAEQRELF